MFLSDSFPSLFAHICNAYTASPLSGSTLNFISSIGPSAVIATSPHPNPSAEKRTLFGT